MSRCRLRAVRGQRGLPLCRASPHRDNEGWSSGKDVQSSLTVCVPSELRPVSSVTIQLLWPPSAPPLSSWSLSRPVTRTHARTHAHTHTHANMCAGANKTCLLLLSEGFGRYHHQPTQTFLNILCGLTPPINLVCVFLFSFFLYFIFAKEQVWEA